MAERKKHDIIFIDMKLQPINGLNTHLRLREINPDVTVVMMTAYREEMAELIENALKSNAYAYISQAL